MDDFGGAFWVKVFAILVGAGLAILLCLVFISELFLRWGLVGGFLALGVILLAGAWLYDKREARMNREFDT
jgi:hypothetical protein